MKKGERSVVVLRTTTTREEGTDTGAGLIPGLYPAVLHPTLAHLVAPDMTEMFARVIASDTLARLPTANPLRVLRLPVEGTRIGPIIHVQGLVPLRLANDPTTAVLALHAPQIGVRLPIVPCHHITDPQPLLLPEKQDERLV